jgi:pseudouridine-5'-phosphate glycosidase
MAKPSDLDIAPSVAEALREGRPVVALESTIIVHGMAYPDNLATAMELERIVGEQGAVAATIAVLSGRLRVGLTSGELDHLARGQNILKASTHDLPFAIVGKYDAATTVAATMRIAAMAGIALFATGGIGGVHRGARDSFDISTDITELGRTKVAVVSAGAKAILDLPATLEALETAGVPVIGFRTDDFPAFYSRSSGLKIPMRLDTVDDMAAFIKAKWRLGLDGGVLIANPIAPEDEIAASEVEGVIAEALAAARHHTIAAKAVTPYLLAQINARSGGRSLRANMALAKNNARLAAQIACALTR